MEVVVWLCFAPLLWFLGKCHGQTQFLYMDVYESELISCEGNKWKVSTKSNKIDPKLLVQCDHIRIELDVDDKLEFCNNKPPQSKCFCTLEVKSGFVACVKSRDSGLLFPFKPSPNVVYSYIVAAPNPLITSTPEETSSLTVPEGESVSLNCSFTFTQDYNGVPFVVYWIKTVGENSTCVYSYDYSKHRSPQYGHHCTIQEDLLNRLSNQTKGQNSHNIRISEVMESDSGQYLCAVQVDPDNKNTSKRKWKVIERVTVSVHKDKRPQPTRTTVTQTTTEKTTKKTTEKTTKKATEKTTKKTTEKTTKKTSEKTTKKATEKTTKKATEKTTKKATEKVSDDDRLKPLFIAVSIILCLLLIVLVVFIRKKCVTSQGRQTGQQREEAPDMDCSPYAVGNDEEGSFFGSKTADPGREESTPSIDPYSVVRLNSLYESGASGNSPRSN